MSVIGIDLGNRNAIVAVAQRGGIDIVLNETSNRQTPVVLGFSGNERFIGEAGSTQYARNVRNTITHLKRIIGRKWYEKELQDEIPYLPFRLKEGPNSLVQIDVDYNGTTTTFTPEELMGMMLGKLKETTEKNLKTKMKDVVISVPGFYTSAQRRAMLDAAQIAQLNPLRLLNENTATALSYGIYRELPEKDAMNVMFVDMGDSALSVAIVAFSKGKLKVLGTAYDRTLGGRNFDRLLVDHFAAEFKQKFRVDAKSNTKALIRLEMACEKLKKILSANSQAPISVESLLDDVDCRGMLSRDEFEKMAAPLLERIKIPVAKVMADTGITPDKLHSIELVGGASRMPQVGKIVNEVTGKEYSRTLNAEESVARGCALDCAILSPVFKVREFKIEDCTPYPIDLVWKDIKPVGDTTSMDAEEPTQIFPRFAPVPGIKIVTFPKGKPFEMKASYSPSAELPPGVSSFIGQWTINEIPPTQSGEPAKVRVKVKLDLNMIFSVEYAQMVESYEVQEEVKKEEAPKSPATPEAPKTPESPAASPSTTEGAAPSETKTVTKTRRTNLVVQETTDGMLPIEVQRALEAELKRVAQDQEIHELAEARNAVESYVYDTRSDLSGDLAPYATDEERERFSSMLNDAETWLYEEGRDAKKTVYQDRLASLRRVGDVLQHRRREDQYRDEAVTSLEQTIEFYKQAAQGSDPRYEHIAAEEKAKVVKKVEEARDAMLPKIALQRTLRKDQDPVVLTADIIHTKENLDRFCQPILNKPKPAPPKVEEPKKETTPAPTPAPTASSTANGPAASGATEKEGGQGEVTPEPMATEKKKEGGPSAMDLGDD